MDAIEKLERLRGYMDYWVDKWPYFPSPFASYLKKVIGAERHALEIAEIEKKRNNCFYCNREMDYKIRTRDHIIPRSRGGTGLKDNTIYACIYCNRWKRDSDLSTWYSLVDSALRSPPRHYDKEKIKNIMMSIKRIKKESKFFIP